MSSPAVEATGKKVPWIKLAVVAAVIAVGALLLLRGVDVRAWTDRGMALIRDAGPTAFFLSMAFLPAVGVPMLAFTLTAGSAFAGLLGMPMVVGLCLVATVVNLVFTYFLARRALRPSITWLVQRLGYKMPRVADGDSTSLIVIFRVTPGIPFFAQNYLLGLAEVPFVRYMLISCALSLPQTVGFVIFGDALQHGKGKLIIAAVGLLVAAALVTQLLRKRYAARNSAV
jgi:uncharacterized membrane protein YdjX (TVP38/TMEM64 family)